MNPQDITDLEALRAQSLADLTSTMDHSLTQFLLLVILGLLFFTLLARLFLQSRPGLISNQCHVCGGELKRIHQVWWLRFVAPLLPFRTMYCKPCGLKSVRVKPPPRPRHKRRRSSRKREITAHSATGNTE